MTKEKPSPEDLLERFRNRIVEMREVRCGDIEPHPKNPRTHPGQQIGAVTGLLVEIGKFIPLIAFPADGLGPEGDFSRLMYADGHCRSRIDPNEIWKVCVTDLTREEADKALFADATTGMAGWDPELTGQLIREVNTSCQELADLLTSVYETATEGLDETDATVDPEAYSDLDEENGGLDGMEDVTLAVVVPAQHAEAVNQWLRNGEENTGPGRGKGVLRRCDLL